VPSDWYKAEDTERSWGIYEEVNRSYPDAIVIGGWASWLHNRAAKSHDIDLIVSQEDLADMKQALDLTENSHFGTPKWRGTYDGIHLDVYAAHRSRLGTLLQLPVECLVEHREDIDGFPTLCKEALLVAKSAARLDRPDTLPGHKDAEDMAIMLLNAPDVWDFTLVHRVAKCSMSSGLSGVELVLEAVSGLSDEASNKSRRKALDRISKEMKKVFLSVESI
jgi:hypothetical protein